VARLVIEVAGQQLTLEREVVRRTRDQAVGEVRRPVRIVPAVEITVEPSLLLWDPEDSASREIRVVLTSYDDVPIRGRLVARLPFGWVAPEITFAIDDPAGQTVISVPISAPAELEPGFHDLSFEARIDNGPASHLAVPLMEYSHIRPTPLPQPARVRVSVFDLDLPDVGTVGYVRGASDRVPEFLRQVGLAVELLDGETLADGDLSRFRVIVVGSRAYESDPNLAASNSRLVDFVRAGGLLVVQYQQYQFVRGALVPLALEIARPHDRITDENAPVRLLVPDHAAFTTPNQLGDADWQGWVQERGLYFAHTWDEAFEPLMALRDPGMEEQSGGLLVARFGEGTYVYTGLAFFRQLPAGVAGGYRLLANLCPWCSTRRMDGRSCSRSRSATRSFTPRSTCAGSTWARRTSSIAFDPRAPIRRPTSGSADPTRSSRRAPTRACWNRIARPGRARSRSAAQIRSRSTGASTAPHRCWCSTAMR